MRAILLAGCAALALGACRSETTANNDMAADNLTLEENAALTGGMDANAATNATTENMMMNDITNNDADTNLSNGY